MRHNDADQTATRKVGNSTVADKKNSPLPNEARRDTNLNTLEKAIKARDRRAKTAPLGVVAATLAVLVLLVGGIWFASTYSSNDDNVAEESSSAETTPAAEAAALPAGPTKPYGETVKCEYKAEGEASKEVKVPESGDVKASGTTKVTLKTNSGEVPIELDASKSPCSANSFEHLVQAKFYDNTVCHRSVKSAGMTILQCGDPTGVGSGGPGYSFGDEYPTNGVSEAELENPVTYPRGTLAMANSGPDTNGSQFFLVTGETQLPPKYNVFGTISEEGLKTLDGILEKAPEGDGKPAEEVKIESAQVA